VDLGPLGVKRSSAQVTDRYRLADLVGRQVVCVVNFPPKQVGPFVSEVLVMGSPIRSFAGTASGRRPAWSLRSGSAPPSGLGLLGSPPGSRIG